MNNYKYNRVKLLTDYDLEREPIKAFEGSISMIQAKGVTSVTINPKSWFGENLSDKYLRVRKNKYKIYKYDGIIKVVD